MFALPHLKVDPVGVVRHLTYFDPRDGGHVGVRVQPVNHATNDEGSVVGLLRLGAAVPRIQVEGSILKKIAIGVVGQYKFSLFD